MASKRLLVFCDSTGQDGMIAPDGPTHDLTPSEVVSTFYDGVAKTLVANGGGSDTQPVTNVLRLARAVTQYSRENSQQQIVFYQSGIGLEANFSGSPPLEDRKLQAQGVAVASKIRDAYIFLAQNYAIGDEIFLFGFSRGAYMARKLASLIDEIGLLETRDLGLFFDIWRAVVNGDTPHTPAGTRKPRIRCIGLWDTVGSVYNDINALRIKDTTLPACVDIALHAVSLQENRREFRPTLWTVPMRGLVDGQVLKEVWFPGSHIDVGGAYHERRELVDLSWFAGGHSPVGGTYKRHELADIALFWMAGQIMERDLFDLDVDFITGSKQENADNWGSSQPQNGFHDTKFVTRRLLHLGDRLSTGDITGTIALHASWRHAPNVLQDPRGMVTPNALETTFPGLRYEDPTAFEMETWERWKDAPRPDSLSIVYDDVSKLFSSALDLGSSGAMSSRKIPPHNALLGGEDFDGTSFYIGRAVYEDGIYPGKYRNGQNALHISRDGREILLCDYELLVGNGTNVRWIRMTGPFAHDKLCGFHPVHGGKDGDGEFLYIIQGFHEGGVHCGRTKLGADGLIPYDGSEVALDTYNVLVFDSDLYRFRNTIGRSLGFVDWMTVKQGDNYSRVVGISPPAPIPPVILVGLNKVDVWGERTVQVRTDADGIDCSQFTVHFGTHSDGRLYDNGASWLKLASGDPGFQYGVVKCDGGEMRSIPFNWRFEQQPTVYVGLRGFKVSGDRRLSVSVGEISRADFTLHVDGWGNTESLVCWVTWIAFYGHRKDVVCGTFGATGETDSSYTGSIRFASRFRRPPMVFTALTALDMDSNSQVRVDVHSPTNVTSSGMDWTISTWAGSKLKKVRVAYLALEPDS